MSPSIFDTHAHYLDEKFDPDREILLNNLKFKNVKTVIECSAKLEDSYRIIDLANKYPFIYGAVGIHPEYSLNLPANWMEDLKSLAKFPKIKAIGEIGLDYHYKENLSKNAQIELFKSQIELAKSLDLPIIVHDRDAHADTMDLLIKYQPKAVIHCFSGSIEMANQIINLGMYIGIGGTVTFKNAKSVKAVAQNIPLDRILLETDAPYLAPAPHRGERNDSSLIYLVAETIAELRGESTDKILDISCHNAEVFFNITGDF